MTNSNQREGVEKGVTRAAAFRPLDVVLVDDSAPIRQRVAASLATVNGVDSIREAGDVPAGRHLLEVSAPDVLILDIEMPGESGIDLLRTALSMGCRAVIIMLSIHDHPMLRQRCLALGASHYFHKLTEFKRVAEVCGDLVEQRRLAAGE